MHRFRRPLSRRILIGTALAGALIGGSFAQQAHAAPRASSAPHKPAHITGQGTYTIQAGDTLSAIALAYGTTVAALISANNLTNGDVIVPGQVLNLSGADVSTDLAPAVTASIQTDYTVQPGDTLSAIADRLGTTIDALATANNLASPYLITAGQSLAVPGGTQVADNTSTASTTVDTTQASLSSATYAVQMGDTLSAIAANQGVTLEALAAANNLSSPYLLTVGQQLVVPGGAATVEAVATTDSSAVGTTTASASTYLVQSGDTLSGIADRLGVSLDALTAANSSINPSALQVGQTLSIPAGAALVEQSSAIDQSDVGTILTEQAQADGLDVGLVKAIAWQESGWQMVTASDGGMGIMQLMPDSVDWVSATLLGTPIDPYNAADNVKAGVTMLSYYMNVFGDETRAIAAYHQGMASLQAVGILPETQGYVANVLALQQQFDS
jgi:LysM repeat protein